MGGVVISSGWSARLQIPQRLWGATPVRLLATAGLRLLTEQQSSAILASCSAALAASSFRCHASHVAVLEGDMEGLYGWAAANFASGALQAASAHQHSGRREAAAVQGFQGIMEMGGASMQITFLPLLPLEHPNQAGSLLRLPGVPLRLFTHSYLGMGMDSALSRAAAIVLQQQPNSETVYDPCLPIGYISDDGRHGAATFDGCLHIARQIVPALNCSEHQALAQLTHLFHSTRCTLEGSFVPTLDGPFIAMENFFWTAKALNLHTGATLRHLATAAEAHCSKHWSSLHAEFSGHIPDQYLVRYCFGAVYVYTLLHEVFQLGLDEQRLAFTNSVQGPSGGPITLSWVLGAMVVEGMAEGKRFADGRLATVIKHALFPGLRSDSQGGNLPSLVSAVGQGSDVSSEDASSSRDSTSSTGSSSSSASSATSLSSVTHNEDPPTFVSATGRIVAVGDLHGDLDKAISALKLAQCIAVSGEGVVSWIGGDTTLVQLGDVLDRGDVEIGIINLLRFLDVEARKTKGAVYMLNGNHESLNVCGDFRYVTPGAFAESAMYAGLSEDDLKDWELVARVRYALYRPGGDLAKELAKNPTVLVVNDTVFAHGGLLPRHVAYGVERMNLEVAAWMRGDNAENGGKAPPPQLAMG
ncbi:MAG: hypothetical protein WDW38_008610 [Sanguina aurantia]